MSSVFFPERRHPIRQFLRRELFSRRIVDGDEADSAAADDLDLTIPRRQRPPPGGVKLWQLLAVLFTLFAGHYKLVELTVAGTAKDIRNEITLAQARGDGRYDEAMRRLQQLEAERTSEANRMGAMEATDDRQDRELVEIKLNQRAVMRKLNLQP